MSNAVRDEAAPFDTETLTLDIQTRTATFVGNVGVSNRVDIGAAVPLIDPNISGSRVNDYRGPALLQARVTAETIGMGDVAVRSKVRLTPDGLGAVAVAASPRVTVVGEVLAWRIDGLDRIIPVAVAHPRISGVDTIRLTPAGEAETTAFGVAGIKWNVGGTWLLHRTCSCLSLRTA